MKKTITNIMMFLGYLVMLVGFVIAGLDKKSTALVLTMEFAYPTIAATLAVCFIHAKNNVVKNVGYALAALSGIYGILMLTSATMVVSAVGLIIMLLASLGYVVVLLLEFFGFVKAGKQGINSNDISTLLGRYKEMEKEQVITEEEFMQLKGQALQTLTEKECVTLDDLKKWKKLLDQKVITEEEFAQLKAKVFTK